MKHIGLFEGIGGFSLSARYAGWETIAWCEWDAFCQTVLKYHFPHATPHSDIRTTDFTGYHGKVDILTGGFPCQPYSTAGKRKGTDDERHLWPEMLRAIREISPGWVVGENVGGLISWSGGLVFEQVQTDLEAEGYEVQAFVLPACGVDAPHRRDRVWFVARQITSDSNYNGSYGPKNRQGMGARNNGNAPRQNKAVKLARCTVSDAWPTSDSDSHGHKLRGLGQDRSAPVACEGFKKEWQRLWPNAGGIGEPETITNTNGAGRRQQLASKPGFAIQDIPNWRGFPTQPPICGRNDGLSSGMARITVPARGGKRRTLTENQAKARIRRESIKAFGNAIVLQVALQIFKAINEIENR